jgi:O-antigen ligase
MLAQTILDPDLLPTAGRRWDWAMLGLLVALLAFAPAAFGAVEAWSELTVVIAAAGLAICLALRVVFDREFRPGLTWLHWPLLLFVLLTAVQILPLPAALVAGLSPSTVATKQELLDGGPLRRTTLSFYPQTTAHHLRLVLVGTTVFVTVASAIRNPRQVKNLLLAIFAIGCAQAVLAIAQIATATDKIYWSLPTGRRLATSGSFVNYSHFSQFMNLSLGAGIALFLIQLHDERRQAMRGAMWRTSLSRLNWEQHGPVLAGIVLCAVTVLSSMSRNGAISLFIAAAVIGAALYRRGSLSWRGWLLGGIPLAVLVVLFVVGFDAVYERLATLKDTRAYESRWEMTAATLRAFSHYPLWGTGLGTHEFVFPMFDTAVTPVLAAHADNDYAQLLEEMGVAGAALVAFFVIGVAALAVQLIRRGKSASSAAAYGIAFGLIAVAVHSASDFGQRVPANFCLSATFCGMLVAITRLERRAALVRRGEFPSSEPSPWLRRGVAAAALVCAVLAGAWAARGAYSAYFGERWWAAALAMESRIQRAPDDATDSDYIDLLAAAERAFESDPANVQYGYWLNSYRWESLSRSIDPETGRVLLRPDELPFVARIADELAALRRICPTFGPPYALEGQLRLLVLGDERGAELIRKGVRLARYDAPTCLVAGELAARQGKLDEAQPLLTRAVALQPAYFRDVADIYLLEAKRPDLARSLAGDDYRRLEELARACAAIPQYSDLAVEVRNAATASLRRRAATSEVTPQELVSLARIEDSQGNRDSAIELYRRAVEQDYRQIDWRLELARSLAASNRLDEAIRQVRVCLRLRPHYTPAVKLMDELIARSESR